MDSFLMKIVLDTSPTKVLLVKNVVMVTRVEGIVYVRIWRG